MTDREQLLALYRACFPEDDPQFWNWVFDNLYAPENTLNVRENGIIIASLQMIPCNMRLKDRLFEAHYIYAASTLPSPTSNCTLFKGRIAFPMEVTQVHFYKLQDLTTDMYISAA